MTSQKAITGLTLSASVMPDLLSTARQTCELCPRFTMTPSCSWLVCLQVMCASMCVGLHNRGGGGEKLPSFHRFPVQMLERGACHIQGKAA